MAAAKNPIPADVRASRYRRKLTDLLGAAKEALRTGVVFELESEIETVSTQLEVEEKYFGAPTNVTRDQLVTLLRRLTRSAYDWNQSQADGDRGPGNSPIVLVLFDDGSGAVASRVYGELRDVMNVQSSFDNPEECADCLIKMHDALEAAE
jgi:hypothetical protein